VHFSDADKVVPGILDAGGQNPNRAQLPFNLLLERAKEVISPRLDAWRSQRVVYAAAVVVDQLTVSLEDSV
jgi:hypothetical protein